MAANRIKGITIEIGGDTTKLQTALKGVDQQVRSTQAQLKDVNKLLKLDPGNTELLAQKHKLLGDAVTQTKERLETLKTAAAQANEALARGDISQGQYDALQREIVETEQELKRLEEQANSSATALQKIAADGEKLKTMGNGVQDVGKKFLPVTGAVVGLGTAAVKTAADFDSSMSKVSAVSGASGKDLEDLTAKAREMGAKTKFSASEAADAMNYMAMAGWDAGQMMDGIEGVMNLAAASGEDLATTSDIVTDALTAFGLKAEDSGHFADVLAAASSSANTNVSMMGETFKYAAPVAGALGFSVEDTAEAIGLMANAGVKGSQAGTALRTIMNNLTSDIELSGAALGDVVIKTTNADGSMRELSDILGECRVAFAGLSESEKAQAAEALVGKNAMSGFLAIMNAGEADITKVSGAIAECDGRSEEMAKTMQDNLEGQLTILKSQLQELAISFGTMLMPVIRDIVGWIQGLVGWLNSMDEGTRKVIITVALVAAAIGPVLIIVGKVMSAVGTIMTVVPKLAGVIGVVQKAFASLNLTMLANPIVLIVAAIAALAAAFIYLWNTSDEFRAFWIGLWEAVKDAAVKVWQTLGAFFKDAWSGISETAGSVWGGLREFFAGFWNGVKNVFTSAAGGLVSFLAGAWKEMVSSAKQAWDGIREAVLGVMRAVSDGVSKAWASIQAAVGNAMKVISDGISSGWNAIREVISNVMKVISELIGKAWGFIQGVTERAMAAVSEVIGTAWAAIQGVIGAAMEAIGSVISSAWASIQGAISTAMETIRSVVVGAFESLKGGIASSVNGIYETIRGGFERMVGYLKGLASSAFSWGSDIIGGIVKGIRSAIGALKDAVDDVAEVIKSYLHFSVPDVGPLTDYESWMPDFMKGLAEGIERSKAVVADAMESLASEMVVEPNVGDLQLMAAGGPGYSRAAAGGNGAGGTGGAGFSGMDLSGLVDAVKEALSGLQHDTGKDGDIVIPVYLGGTMLDEVIVNAQQRANLRSGGR